MLGRVLTMTAKEAFKGVVWCHGPVALETGEEVHRYLVVGMLITDKPIASLEAGEGRDIDSEAILCGPCDGLADALANVEQGEADVRLGDASMVLLQLGRIHPRDLPTTKE